MRLLILGSEESFLIRIKGALEYEGYTVDYHLDWSSCEHTLALYQDSYDILILDCISLAELGIEFCREIRRQGIILPVIMLSDKNRIEEKVQALDSGADDYIAKPLYFSEILARIRAVSRRPKQTLIMALSISNVVLNPASRRVICRGQEVVLTAKEFSVLEFFMRHPNQVLTRDQILDHVWDFEFDSFSNVVDVHIKNIRKKIVYHSGQLALETVRGVGYRLSDLPAAAALDRP